MVSLSYQQMAAQVSLGL